MTSRVKGPRDLGATKRAICKQTPVIPRKGHTLGNTLVNNIIAYLCEAVGIGFSGPEIATLYGVIEKTPYAVTVIRIILCRIYPTLGRNTVSSTRAVLYTEGLYVIAQFSKCCRC